MNFQTTGANLYYEQYGSGEPLIMLHGNGEDHKIFDKAIAVLQKYFTIYAIDTRGHGQSSPVTEFHYEDMAQDIYEFITGMNLEKPTVYGFSDGGITALLLAINHPDLLTRIIISGVNVSPYGIEYRWRTLFKLIYLVTKKPAFKLMLEEPNIPDHKLASIKIPVFMTAGSKDMIKLTHVQRIANTIPQCEANIYFGEKHGGYIVHSDRIAKYILLVCGK